MKKEVLDHGFVSLVETWGSDERIIEAARMSTGKGFLGWGPNTCECVSVDNHPEGSWPMSRPGCSKCNGLGQLAGDEKLLKYLWDNKHATPFEMAGAVFEVQAPLFVFREWHRHRTQSYNELSARYTPMPDANYVPSVKRLMMNAGASNKQAGTVKGAAELDAISASNVAYEMEDVYKLLELKYRSFLERGVPKELARLIIPVGRYSRMRASANLRNWLGFLTLRDDVNAQWEIRSYAGVVRDMLAEKFPRTMTLFTESRAR